MKKYFDTKIVASAAVGSVVATLVLMPIVAPIYSRFRVNVGV